MDIHALTSSPFSVRMSVVASPLQVLEPQAAAAVAVRGSSPLREGVWLLLRYCPALGALGLDVSVCLVQPAVPTDTAVAG